MVSGDRLDLPLEQGPSASPYDMDWLVGTLEIVWGHAVTSGNLEGPVVVGHADPNLFVLHEGNFRQVSFIRGIDGALSWEVRLRLPLENCHAAEVITRRRLVSDESGTLTTTVYQLGPGPRPRAVQKSGRTAPPLTIQECYAYADSLFGLLPAAVQEASIATSAHLGPDLSDY